MTASVDGHATFQRRLERWRTARGVPADAPPSPSPAAVAADRARAMAAVLDGELIADTDGATVRIDRPSRALPIDRERLARLPGHAAADVPLLCLDTETTGLGTATGTFAFLVGLGWWEGDRFRQVQLLLPDQAHEPAFLRILRASIPRGTWLVTYNGRGFDWPLLETRYRLGRTAPPDLDGHVDLLPFVRRVFRHRLPDARLRSVEEGVLGLSRIGDVEGWQIPGRYLEVLRGATPALLAEVVHHNDLDVRSLANLLAHVERTLGDVDTAAPAPPAGDLAGLARAYRRHGRRDEALACLDAALAVADERLPDPPAGVVVEPWWSAGRPADIGGQPPTRRPGTRSDATPWTFSRISTERARLLRVMGRPSEAIDAWTTAAAGGGRPGILAWIEVAKLREHHFRDDEGALGATSRAGRALERARILGRPDPLLERAVGHRAARLRRRIARADRAQPGRSRDPTRSAAVG